MARRTGLLWSGSALATEAGRDMDMDIGVCTRALPEARWHADKLGPARLGDSKPPPQKPPPPPHSLAA